VKDHSPRPRFRRAIVAGGIVAFLALGALGSSALAGGDDRVPVQPPPREQPLDFDLDAIAESGLPRPVAITGVIDSSSIVQDAGDPRPKQACPTVPAGAAGDVDALLASLPGRFVPDPDVALPLRLNLELGGSRPVESSLVVDEDGTHVTPGRLDSADATITLAADALAGILAGTVDARELVLCEGARVAGDLDRATDLVRLFPAPARP